MLLCVRFAWLCAFLLCGAFGDVCVGRVVLCVVVIMVCTLCWLVLLCGGV